MDKSAVDAIIAEAMDACALDQIAKLNTAHLSSSSDSSLPSDLESRFRKLKSFPARTTATASPAVTATRSLNFGKENNAPTLPPASVPIVGSGLTGSDGETESSSPVVTCGEKPKGIETQSEVKVQSGVETGEDVKSKKASFAGSDFGSGFSPSKRSGPQPDPSPLDRLGCCFFLSPKKATSTTPKSKQKNGNGGSVYDMDLGVVELDELSDNKKFLADIKGQQKKLKKALKEQEKVSREAAKLVRYARHASARMRANTDELFSDEDEDELRGTHFH
ncbi:vitellogenin-2 protein [Rhynchospora pubera]|uniref:Vitellogenin-2 protein n=1 Tax=Rhynchospora pubera TaxID=906938 RepID=A0AAV8EWF0_9POAL|nr:vitellogenin-2 protein [Rhynchospora pubera]